MAGRPEKKKSEVRLAAGALGSVVITLAVVSGVVNILALTGSFYMLQVYDRVLSSRSMATLLALSLLAVGLYLFQGGLEVIRSQILVRLAGRLDRQLTKQAMTAAMRLRAYVGAQGSPLQPIRDVDAVRTYLSGQGPVAILDMPWMPLYLAFVFILHPMLGWITMFGAAFLLSVAFLTERMMQTPGEVLASASKQRWAIAEACEQNSDALHAMGFGHRFLRRFQAVNNQHLDANERLSDVVGGLSSVSRVFRMMLQSALLGIGAYLTIKGEMSAGAIIACSIAASRALAPIEVAIGNWRVFVAARQACARLDAVLANLPEKSRPLMLPAPTHALSVESISVMVPGSQTTTLSNVNFTLKAGTVLAVIGPSAAGKSTLARALTGVWPLARGAVRLDGAALGSWSNEEFGKHVGYLPQDVQLFDGTITENISRFEEQPDSQRVIAASRAADVHEMVLRLPNGYETRIGSQGSVLSAGQRQRIALARALYGNPFLLVLDEPNSNLDSDGEMALGKAIDGVKARGGIVVVIAHRPSLLSSADLVAVIGNGQLNAIGPRDEILRKVLRHPATAPAALAIAADGSK
ncbi:MAG TPA: type I secretion system permease/ATPase [Hyphomicrobiaceae bacterium]|nr:type I secretion system permease/ATPase [Hyphomicrobiaceae bacterium]